MDKSITKFPIRLPHRRRRSSGLRIENTPNGKFEQLKSLSPFSVGEDDDENNQVEAEEVVVVKVVLFEDNDMFGKVPVRTKKNAMSDVLASYPQASEGSDPR
jgi:hypothetical protein